MKKIICLFIVLLIICSLAISCFAYDSFTYDFQFSPEEGYFVLGVDVPHSGSFRYTVNIYANGTVLSGNGVLTLTPVYEDGISAFIAPISTSIVSDGFNPAFIGTLILVPSQDNDGFAVPSAATFEFTSGSTVTAADFSITLDRIIPPSFVEASNDGLTSVIDWIGSFVSSVLSGPLFPLLVLLLLGISVTFLLLTYRIIKKITWG